jgi:hypothetical protein
LFVHTTGDDLKTVLISDTAALGMMEVRPEPAWRVKLTGLRNKDLLAPDYGAMHVAAALKAGGRPGGERDGRCA